MEESCWRRTVAREFLSVGKCCSFSGSDVSRKSEVNSDDRPLHRRNNSLFVSTVVALPSPVHHVISNVGAMRHIWLSVARQRSPPLIYTPSKMRWVASEGSIGERVGGR
ncbi:hypothetical protein V6N13_012251 [Hibiscus sabdariffa]|uniref:Uncharacterized protein n=1 Tax=Hibiscus sabdariffa TaxID=183260 RepID=A0ABR2SEL2_9ROSI